MPRSKYDDFWLSICGLLKNAIYRAYVDGKAVIDVSSIRVFGRRKPESWRGSVVIYKDRVVSRSNMAHIISLARVLVDRELLLDYDAIFRFSINKELKLRIVREQSFDDLESRIMDAIRRLPEVLLIPDPGRISPAFTTLPDLFYVSLLRYFNRLASIHEDEDGLIATYTFLVSHFDLILGRIGAEGIWTYGLFLLDAITNVFPVSKDSVYEALISMWRRIANGEYFYHFSYRLKPLMLATRCYILFLGVDKELLGILRDLERRDTLLPLVIPGFGKNVENPLMIPLPNANVRRFLAPAVGEEDLDIILGMFSRKYESFDKATLKNLLKESISRLVKGKDNLTQQIITFIKKFITSKKTKRGRLSRIITGGKFDLELASEVAEVTVEKFTKNLEYVPIPWVVDIVFFVEPRASRLVSSK